MSQPELFPLAQYPSFFRQGKFAAYTLDEDWRAESSLGTLKKLDSADGSKSVVVKRACIRQAEPDYRMQLILRDFFLRPDIEHENIVKYLSPSYKVPPGSHSLHEQFYHVTTYGGDTLKTWIEQGEDRQYSIEDAKKWTREALRALEYLHSKREIHAHLTPKKLCIDANKKLTLTGFGRDKIRSMDGNEHQYMPLEQQIEWNADIDKNVDLWSVVTIMAEVISGQPLFRGKTVQLQVQYCDRQVNRALLAKVADVAVQKQLRDYARVSKDFFATMQSAVETGRGITDDDVTQCESTLTDFLVKTLRLNPDRRISTQEALSHPFLHFKRAWEEDLSQAEAVSAIRNRINQISPS